MVCNNCGSANPDDAVFCVKCGNRILLSPPSLRPASKSTSWYSSSQEEPSPPVRQKKPWGQKLRTIERDRYSQSRAHGTRVLPPRKKKSSQPFWVVLWQKKSNPAFWIALSFIAIVFLFILSGHWNLLGLALQTIVVLLWSGALLLAFFLSKLVVSGVLVPILLDVLAFVLLILALRPFFISVRKSHKAQREKN